MSAEIATVGEEDLDDLLPLVRGYLDFYAVEPTDADMARLSRAPLSSSSRRRRTRLSTVRK